MENNNPDVPADNIMKTKKKGGGFAISSLILGIFAILGSFTMIMASVDWSPGNIFLPNPVYENTPAIMVFLIPGAVFGWISFSKHKRKLAFTGLILSALSIILTIASVITVTLAEQNYKRQIISGINDISIFDTTNENTIMPGQTPETQKAAEPEIPIPDNDPQDFEYEFINGSSEIMITGYKGSSKIIGIPETIEGKKVTVIDDYAFYGNSIEKCKFPDSLIKINYEAFSGNMLENISLPAGLLEIGEFAFINNHISELIIPEGVTIIGDQAFKNNHLKRVVIPPGVKEIGSNAFENQSLESINFTRNTPLPIIRPKLASITIPANIAKTGTNAFGIYTGYYNVNGKQGGEYTRTGNNFFFNGEQLPGMAILLTESAGNGVYLISINGQDPDRYGTDGYYFLPPGTYSVEASYSKTDSLLYRTYIEGTFTLERYLEAAKIYYIDAENGTGSEGQDIFVFSIEPETYM